MFGILLFFAQPVPAVGCSSSGFGDESCSTVVTCASGAQLNVHAVVDEPGSVSGYNRCGGAEATCSGSQKCTGYSPTNTVQATNGNCGGSGNGGAWTSLIVTCGGVLAESSPIQQAYEALRKADAVAPLAAELEAVMSSAPGRTTWLLGTHGVVAGYACSNGSGCLPVTVRCEVRSIGWACSTA